MEMNRESMRWLWEARGRSLVGSLVILAIPVGFILNAGVALAAEHPALVSAQTAQCVLCHEDLLEKRSSVHPPAVDDCTLCHEVTVEERSTTVTLAEPEPGLCLLCHDDLEAAAELELEAPHYPVNDSCLNCHDPHAGEVAPVLTAGVGELCAQCHDAADREQPHAGQLTAGADCTSCHQPHGSGNEHMLAGSRLHAPFEGGSCDACHRAPFGGRVRLRVRGERLCEACHGEMAGDVGPAGSAHAALQGESGRPGCLSCHDPHLSDSRALLARRGAELCADCHGEVVAAARARTGHPPAADDCLNCHQPHASTEPRLLIEPRSELCATCHDLEPPPPPPAADIEIVGAGRESYGPADIVAAGDYENGTEEASLCSAPFPPSTWEGQIVVCERGDEPRVLKSENVRAGGAGGLVLVNREEGRDDIFADPHSLPAVHLRSSDAATLASWLEKPGDHRGQIESGRLLLSALAPAAPVEGDLVTAHLGADLATLDCNACHSPHGAGHAKLLAEHLHPPVEDGCDTCHEGRFDELMEGGGSELCLFCHDDVGEHPVPHAALEFGSCTECHNPHATAQEKLVKAPGAGPCAECHDEQTPGEGEVAHGVIDLVGCRACHEPHGGENEKLLRQTGAELCLSCHAAGAVQAADDASLATLAGRFEVRAVDAAAVRPVLLSPDGQRNHPVAGHRTVGKPTEAEIQAARVESTFEDELSCLTCHDPHKGRSRQLFRWNAANAAEACQACHLK
jgi:predicted CXXCH cytochrome family protein